MTTKQTYEELKAQMKELRQEMKAEKAERKTVKKNLNKESENLVASLRRGFSDEQVSYICGRAFRIARQKPTTKKGK